MLTCNRWAAVCSGLRHCVLVALIFVSISKFNFSTNSCTCLRLPLNTKMWASLRTAVSCSLSHYINLLFFTLYTVPLFYMTSFDCQVEGPVQTFCSSVVVSSLLLTLASSSARTITLQHIYIYISLGSYAVCQLAAAVAAPIRAADDRNIRVCCSPCLLSDGTYRLRAGLGISMKYTML